MKLNKIQFKKILKQCIRELITEGAFNNVIKENVGSANLVSTVKKRPTANDFVSSNKLEEAAGPDTSVGNFSPNERLKSLTHTAAALTSKHNPEMSSIMENIFADTAQTTLQKQLGAEGPRGAGEAFLVDEKFTKEEIKQDMEVLDGLTGGRGVGHWASVAFGKK